MDNDTQNIGADLTCDGDNMEVILTMISFVLRALFRQCDCMGFTVKVDVHALEVQVRKETYFAHRFN